jgi:hypothetical protein
MLLYRFDNLPDFPLLTSKTTTGVDVRLDVEGTGTDARLRLVVRRSANNSAGPANGNAKQTVEESPTVVVLGLPFRAVAGNPETFQLEVCGYAGGCHVIAEAGDALGWGFAYAVGKIDATGPRICRVDARQPEEFYSERRQGDTLRVVPPVQLHMLRVMLDNDCDVLDLGLEALLVSGNVRLSAPGVAGGGYV